MSWLKLSELVINFTKALRCAETQYHIFANFKLHIQTSSLKAFPPNVTLGMFTHRAPVSIPLLLSSACFGFTVWISLQHQHPKHTLSKNTLPMHSAGTTTSAWTRSECNCCRCHHSLSSSTYQEAWPNITSPSHLPSLVFLLVRQTRLLWLHREPEQRIN